MKKEQLKESVGELNCVDTVFEDGGGSYIDTAVSVTQVYDLIDQLDELNKPLVVPKELGEWLACQELGNEGSFFSIIIELEDMWLGSSFEEFITDNKKQLIEVIIGNRDYEIEKEKLYYIKFSESQYAQKFDGTKFDSMLINDESIAGKFTKDDIEKMNPKLMALAVEVAE